MLKLLGQGFNIRFSNHWATNNTNYTDRTYGGRAHIAAHLTISDSNQTTIATEKDQMRVKIDQEEICVEKAAPRWTLLLCLAFYVSCTSSSHLHYLVMSRANISVSLKAVFTIKFTITMYISCVCFKS